MKEEIFNIVNDYIELNKLLKASGLCSTGGMAKVAIESGEVKVDGKVEFRKRAKLKTGQLVEYADSILKISAE